MWKKSWRFIKSICAILGGLVIICGLGFGIYQWNASDAVYVPENSALIIDFSQDINETGEKSLIDELNDASVLRLQSVLQAIELAGYDDHIKVLIARLDTTELEMAQIEDVARAVMNFRASGKKAYVFSQGFGPLGRGNREYYLATFFDKIYMQPHTTIGLTGVSVEVPFAKNLLQKFGIEPEFYARYEYKTAMSSFTDKSISPAYKQELGNLTQGIMQVLTTEIAHNRHVKNIDGIINKAPLSAEEGLNLSLIDEIMYFPDLQAELKQKENVKNFIEMKNYVKAVKSYDGDLPTIAYLTLSGVIDKGQSSSDFDSEYTIGSQNVVSDISEIAELENLKAVIVRIDSPGGDYNAADEIYYALQKLKRDKNVPIIVSQGGYAASGGYFISLAGDKIIAEPLTITGSIGVLGGKPVFQKLWQKIGLNWAEIKAGNNADILSVNKPFSPEEKRIFNRFLDDVYDDFTQKVMDNRPLTKNIDEIARGRVWLGWQAKELGLVDELGGYGEAFAAAQELAKLNPDEKFKLVEYPKAKSFSEKMTALLLGQEVNMPKLLSQSGVDIRYLKLFKRLQYDTVMTPFEIKM